MGETHVRLEDRCFGSGVLADATAMLPSAVLAGIATQVLAAVDLSHANVAISLAAGAVLGFAAAPCALGGVALAGALHAHAPIAATAFLCVAGLFDARTLLHRAPAHHGNDCFAYLLTATALGLVALHGGAGLVNPAITVPLGACAIFLAALFVQHRRARCPSTRIAPALMLAGALVAAPPPIYRATETTLAGGFPGERVTFLGVLARDASHDALVRYAITCCRADAAPIALRLASPVPYPAGTWLRTDGTLVADGDSLVYEATHVERATPPLDPFVYR